MLQYVEKEMKYERTYAYVSPKMLQKSRFLHTKSYIRSFTHQSKLETEEDEGKKNYHCDMREYFSF